MRKISLDASLLNLNSGDVINVELVDSVGNQCYAKNGFTIKEDFTISDSILELELLENIYVGKISSYKLTLATSLTFYFSVPYRVEEISHDFISLLQISCVKGIINQESKELDDDFVKKLNLYFTGKNPHFSATQKEVVMMYEYYADKVKDTPATVDVMEMMDSYLSSL